MGKTAQLEDDLAAHFEGLVQKEVSSEVGLLIGQPGSGSRDLVFGVAPCPPRNNARSAIVLISNFAPDASKAKKGALKAATSARLDVDWIAEHGVQVERMLPGGLQILGLYVYVPETGYQSAVGEICSVMSELVSAGVCKGSQETLVLHVDTGAKRFVMRSCPAGATGAADLKPADIKYGPGLKNLLCLRTVYHVDVWLPATSHDSLHQHLEDIVKTESARIRACAVLQEGKFPDNTAVLADLLPKGADASDPWDLSLYRPLDTTVVSSPTSSTPVCGRGRVIGTLEGRVYCSKRVAFEKGAMELKEDLCRSLRARMDFVAEEADRWTEKAAEDYDGKGEAPKHSLLSRSQLARKNHYSLPFRVFLPWKSGVMMCDYLMPGETLENTQARVKDMLAIEDVDEEQVATAERLDDAPAARTRAASANDASWSNKKWDPHRIEVLSLNSKSTIKTHSRWIVALIFALLAVLLGLIERYFK